jgi:hypothetical protein
LAKIDHIARTSVAIGSAAGRLRKDYHPHARRKSQPAAGILRLGFFQDGDVGVGDFPKVKEILIGRLCLGCVSSHGVGATELEMR